MNDSGEHKGLIITSPYEQPTKHWERKPGSADLYDYPTNRRRDPGYTLADPSKPGEPGRYVPISLVNKIRKRVDAWRKKDYPGVTSVTKQLLYHWRDNEVRTTPFFYCQLEAIETLIWLIETHEVEKSGIEIKGDGSDFRRLCCKLATGTGKTVVMAMLIAWQTINRCKRSHDKRFSKNFFIVSPTLTVRERLFVLYPHSPNNYYFNDFRIVPNYYKNLLFQANILIYNWHVLQWETDEQVSAKLGVDKRGARSDKAYINDLFKDNSTEKNWIVINDEAHHAWRVTANSNNKKLSRDDKKEQEDATRWIAGLDRIHKVLGIRDCFDFSATPFPPTSNPSSEQALFNWIVSDFGLEDAVEAGIVKTPRYVVRDDTTSLNRSVLSHIYNQDEVKNDLKNAEKESKYLPDLVRQAYALLCKDYDDTNIEWQNDEPPASTPPVMITVCNRTETAARIKYAFVNKRFLEDDSTLTDADGILHIDSTVLAKAESEQTGAKKDAASKLREMVNTVGQVGKPGEKVKNVISVKMLSEGWDAKTVTHIMGLRAFTSQLLCEQVIGRGLRRSSYDIDEETGLFEPEYVNIFGVPFEFLPHEIHYTSTPKGKGNTKDDDTGSSGVKRKKRKTKLHATVIEPDYKKKTHEIRWPNVARIDRTYKPKFEVKWDEVEPKEINAAKIPLKADLAKIVGQGKYLTDLTDIDIKSIERDWKRYQTLAFQAASDYIADKHEKIKDWKTNKMTICSELIRLAEEFLTNRKHIIVVPPSFDSNPRRRKLAIILSFSSIVDHFFDAIKLHAMEKTVIISDSDQPTKSTSDMYPWRTRREIWYPMKSHINYAVFDSSWEKRDAMEIDNSKHVKSWVKNDHLGFEITYFYQNKKRIYLPDFLIRLSNDKMLVVETKGHRTERDKVKFNYLKEWVKAVNADGRFGVWDCAETRFPREIIGILEQHVTK